MKASSLALLLSLPVSAQTLYWDTNGPTSDSGNTGGTWDVGATSNWSTDPLGLSAVTTWADDNAAIFSAGTDGTGGWTVTVSGTVDPSSITFAQNGSKTITGGSLLSTGGLSISSAGRATGDQIIIGSLLTGTGALNIAAHGDMSDTGGGASGFFRLGNSGNDFTGDITITAGLVDVSEDSAFGNSANQVFLGAGGGLLARGASVTLAPTRAIVLSGGGNKIFRSYGSTTFNINGPISGSGHVRHTDGGTLVLAGNSTFTGNLDNVRGNTTVSGTLNNTGNVSTFAGTLAFSGASSSAYTGYLHLLSGSTVRLDADHVLPDGSDVLQYGNNTFNVNGRTETVRSITTGSAGDTTANLNLGAGGSLTVTGNSLPAGMTSGYTNATYHGKIAGTGTITYDHATAIASAAQWDWYNTANDFTGNVIITKGRLRIQPGAGGADSVLGNAANDLVFNGDVVASLANQAGTASMQTASGANLILGAGRDIILNNGKEGTFYVWGSTTMTVNGLVTGGGNLRKEDSGVLLLNNTGNNYGGVTKVILGEIRSGAANVLPDTTELVMAGGTVNLNGFSETVESVSGGSGTVTGTAASTLTLLTSGSKSYSGAITGGITLNMNGSGAQTLSGTINTVPTVNINTGTLRFGASDRWGNHTTTSSAVVTVNAGATLESVGYFTTLVNPVLAGGTVLLNGGASANYPAFAFKGTVTVSGSSASNILVGSGVNNVISIGATEADGATTFDVADVTGSPAADLTLNASLKNNRANDDSGERPSGLTKTGAGTLVLTATNGYTGSTLVQQGTLLINGTHTGAGLITAAAGATLGGIGTMVSVDIAAGGVLAPGSSSGTITMGTLSLNSSSILEIELDDPAIPSASDRVVVTSWLDDFGGQLNVSALPEIGTPALGASWLVIDYSAASGSINGGSTLALGTNTTGLNLALDNRADDKQVWLTVVPEPASAGLLLLGALFLRALRKNPSAF